METNTDTPLTDEIFYTEDEQSLLDLLEKGELPTKPHFEVMNNLRKVLFN